MPNKRARNGHIRSPLLKALLLGLLVGLVGLVASPLHFVLGLEENVGLGMLFALRGARAAPPDAVVVSIDKESSEHLGIPDNPDKWPRSLHARLTDALKAAGAEVIAFDVHFIEPRSPEDDRLFAEALDRAGNVVLTEPIKMKEIPAGGGNSGEWNHNLIRIVRPIEMFSRAAVATASFTLPRIPFKVNRFWTFETAAGDSPSVPIITLQLYSMRVYGTFSRLLGKLAPELAAEIPPDAAGAMRRGVRDLTRDIRAIFERKPELARLMLREVANSVSATPQEKRLLASLIMMYSGGSSRYINYYGPPGSIRTIPYYRALEIAEGKDPGVDLRGKAVFVGLSEVLLAERKDSFYTVFSQANGTFISGVEIAATAFSNLLTNTPVRPLGLPSHIAVLLLWGVLMGVVCRVSRVGMAAAGALGLNALYLFVAVHQFEAGNSWYPLIVPLFVQVPLAFVGAVLWNYRDVNKERRNIRTAFEHYLPKDVVDQLSRDVAHIQTGSKVVYGVCLFTDAQQYTEFSEAMEPHELGKFMNRYYETMFTPVKEQGGFVSGIIGDAMLALWVSTRSETALKEKACRAALQINGQLERFDEQPEARRLKTRIGLHCGQILLGHVGALDHYEYTPMGDIVNTASRIEGLNKYLGTNILVSEDVVDQIKGFLTRKMGSFRVKGKMKPVAVYELVCRLEDADERQRQGCQAFVEALNAFGRGAWDEAAGKFQGTCRCMGEDQASEFYLRLCEDFKKAPPEAEWDGIVVMEKK
jgi:adenylate cyclase